MMELCFTPLLRKAQDLLHSPPFRRRELCVTPLLRKARDLLYSPPLEGEKLDHSLLEERNLITPSLRRET
jgi:hypothetical protein